MPTATLANRPGLHDPQPPLMAPVQPPAADVAPAEKSLADIKEESLRKLAAHEEEERVRNYEPPPPPPRPAARLVHFSVAGVNLVELRAILPAEAPAQASAAARAAIAAAAEAGTAAAKSTGEWAAYQRALAAVADLGRQIADVRRDIEGTEQAIAAAVLAGTTDPGADEQSLDELRRRETALVARRPLLEGAAQRAQQAAAALAKAKVSAAFSAMRRESRERHDSAEPLLAAAVAERVEPLLAHRHVMAATESAERDAIQALAR